MLGSINWGSLILGLVVGILLYHFTRSRVGSAA
jgi:hypothetical protein